MTTEAAVAIIAGAIAMPEDMTVEQVFSVAHITPNPITPF